MGPVNKQAREYEMISNPASRAETSIESTFGDTATGGLDQP